MRLDEVRDPVDDTRGQRAPFDIEAIGGVDQRLRAIQSELENPLAKSILEGRFAPKATIYADYRGGRMVFDKAPRKAAA